MNIETVTETVIKLTPQELLDKLGYFINAEQYGGIEVFGNGFVGGRITIRLKNLKARDTSHEGEGVDV